MHENELWQEYAYDGTPLGSIDPNNHNPAEVQLFGTTATMLYRFRDGRVEVLFQHRSKHIKGNPDRWDVSAGGHINVGEDIFSAALRETREEIGAVVKRNDLEFSATYISGEHYLINLFFCDWGNREDDFHFDDEEVSDVKWVDFDHLIEFWPHLKPETREDNVFQTLLLNKIKSILEHHGNLDK